MRAEILVQHFPDCLGIPLRFVNVILLITLVVVTKVSLVAWLTVWLIAFASLSELFKRLLLLTLRAPLHKTIVL